ncbi:hypothetical protein [Herbaspirillum sp. ST 5-3]|uniref:hypothetical protein n=1 Tax=Oxalobacteraceae TaxID=75682 RepID=UPI0010A46398|nr:hypothetical protein [Herbaspirillum sp. ST 5-3]
MANANVPQSVERLLEINLHLANLLSLLEKKVQDEGETLIHSARRYLDDEFGILKQLEGAA